MKLWSDLVTSALLGTSRAPLPSWPSGEEPLNALLHELDRENPERALLAAAALVHTWALAGTQALAVDVLGTPPAPADKRPPCPHRAAECLSEILRAGDERLVREWLSLLAAKRLALPHRWLPELLNLAYQNKTLCPTILPLLDARGRWLAAQHPDWKELVLPTDPGRIAERWETDPIPSRLALLRQLRDVAPEKARDLVTITWSQDAAQDRARIASVFASNLSPADELFLEGMLGDRSKQVRAVAADLLARLPASGLIDRTKERLRPLLALESGFLKSPRIVVTLPEVYTGDMTNDAIVENPQGTGKRAWWLLQMVAAVPPGHWTHTWARPPADLIALATQIDDGWILLEGWSRAAARQHDGEWAEALLQCWLDKPWATPPSWKATYLKHHLEALVCSIPQARLEKWLCAQLNTHRNLLPGQEQLLALLQHHQRPWGEPLTRVLLNRLRALARGEDSAGRNWQIALPDLAFCANPGLADHAEQNWPENELWTQQVDRFADTLHFRRRMSNAFS